MNDTVNVITILSNDVLKEIDIDYIDAFMFAEGGAMGRPGELKYFCTKDSRVVLYKGNRYAKGINGDIVNNLFTILRDKREWFYVQLGMGNHLCMKQEYQQEFEAARNSSDKHIYRAYEEIILGILCRNIAHPSLKRFIDAQKDMYEIALEEIRFGQKRSHWMWYIFPQIKGLGTSPMTQKYAIDSVEEARAYLAHPILSARLKEISNAVFLLDANNPEDIFGYTDALKLKSSMTLFAYISENGSIFHRVLEKYFYRDMDELTLRIIAK